MAAPITHLVSAEVIERLVSTLRMWTGIAVIWIEAVINVALKIVGAVEPRAGSDEQAAAEPLGPVVSVGRAVVGGERGTLALEERAYREDPSAIIEAGGRGWSSFWFFPTRINKRRGSTRTASA
jgi:hypothetical protein